MTPESPAIEARNLAKRFGDVEAVAGVDLEVWESELFGLLGPNGNVPHKMRASRAEVVA